MHSQSIVHRDLKPENVLLTEDGHLKLMDFGSAKDLKHPDRKRRSTVRPPSSRNSTDERKSTFVGTADYVSPEMLLGREASYTMDVWALGCLLFQMLVGKPPFRAGSEYLTFQKVQAALYQTPVDVDRQAADLIGKLLVAEPEDRLGCGPEGHGAGYAAIKAHPFFAGIDWARDLELCATPSGRPPAPTSLASQLVRPCQSCLTAVPGTVDSRRSHSRVVPRSRVAPGGRPPAHLHR